MKLRTSIEFRFKIYTAYIHIHAIVCICLGYFTVFILNSRERHHSCALSALGLESNGWTRVPLMLFGLSMICRYWLVLLLLLLPLPPPPPSPPTHIHDVVAVAAIVVWCLAHTIVEQRMCTQFYIAYRAHCNSTMRSDTYLSSSTEKRE